MFSISSVEATTSGMLGCVKIVSECNKSDLNINCQAQTFWTMGFISGISTESQDHTNKGVFTQDNVKYALIKYCKENPFKDSFDAAYDIFWQIKE
jgi:hypothetical protein